MSKQRTYFLPRTRSDKLWLALMVAPPAIYLIYMVFTFILSYDGRYHGVLESGPECTLVEFIWSELTSTFFLPFFVLITLFWMAAIGVIYLGVRILKHISKAKETPT
jgi:NADH:ubiquinone oxidoreductase subunit 6 (subunit J)